MAASCPASRRHQPVSARAAPAVSADDAETGAIAGQPPPGGIASSRPLGAALAMARILPLLEAGILTPDSAGLKR